MRAPVFAVATTLLASTSLMSNAANAAATCEALPQAINSASITLDVAQSVAAGSYTPAGSRPISGLPAFCRVHGYVTPVPGSKIGLRDLAAAGRLERQARDVRQWRIQLRAGLYEHGHRAYRRIRHAGNRHRTRIELRPGLRARRPTGDRGLVLARGARVDRRLQADRQLVLRPYPGAQLLLRLLDRRPAGTGRGAALPDRFRRRHRRRSRTQSHPSQRGLSVGIHQGPSVSGRRPSDPAAGKAVRDQQRRSGGMPAAKRVDQWRTPDRRLSRRSPRLRLRPGYPALSGRDRPGQLLDAAASRGRSRDLCRAEQSSHRQPD